MRSAIALSRTTRILLPCLVLAAWVVLAVWAAAPSAAADEVAGGRQHEFVLATVSPSISDTEARLQPVVEDANRRLAADGLSVRLRVFGTYTSLVWEMWDEGIDLVIDETFMALSIMRDTGSHPLGALTRPNGALTRSIIVTLASGSIHTLEDLRGHRLAFSKPASSFGHLLPRISLGLDRIGLAEVPPNMYAPLRPDRIAMVFTHDSLSPIIWLHKNRVDAAAVPEHQLDRFEWNMRGRFRRIAASATSPHHLIIHRANLEPEAIEALTAAFSVAFHDAGIGDWIRLLPAQSAAFERLSTAITGLDGN